MTDRHRFTTEQANDIRTRYAAGRASQRALASEYGVSRSAIRLIIMNRTWKDEP